MLLFRSEMRCGAVLLQGPLLDFHIVSESRHLGVRLLKLRALHLQRHLMTHQLLAYIWSLRIGRRLMIVFHKTLWRLLVQIS